MNPEEKSANQIIMTKELGSIVDNVIESYDCINILQYVWNYYLLFKLV